MKRTIKGDGKPFINAANAIMAMQGAQMHFALAGYLTTSSIYLEHDRVSLTIHFSDKPFPRLPIGYKFSSMAICSHEYWSDVTGQTERVRTIDIEFKFKN